MKFSGWTVEQLISYLSLSRQGMDYQCRTRVRGEIYIYNGERLDGKEKEEYLLI